MAIIYKHTNKTGKSYIGCTTYTIEKRWREHVYNRNKDYKFNRAIKKYGVEDWNHEILCECTYEEMFELEIKYIRESDTYNTGYNSSEGGYIGMGMKGKSHTIESKKKMSDSHTGKELSYEHKLKISESTKGCNLGASNGRSKRVKATMSGIPFIYPTIKLLSNAIHVPRRTIDRLLNTGNYSTKYNLTVEYI